MKYRKKPVVIEAIKWTGENFDEIKKFCPSVIDLGAACFPDGTWADNPPSWPLSIPTLEGNHTAIIGDFIIKGIKGEFYPCKPDIFEATYDTVEYE